MKNIKNKILSRIILIIVFAVNFTLSCQSQNLNSSIVSSAKFRNFYTGPVMTTGEIVAEIERKSKSGNSYDLMSLRNYLGGLNILIEKSSSDAYIRLQCKIIDNIIGSSEVSSSIENNKTYKDYYSGWIATETNELNKGTQYREVPLFESYSFFYITQFLYIIKNNGWVDQSKGNSDWWYQTLSFIEKNGWEKWYVRSLKATGNHYWYFLRSRTHMGSHWAGTAMYLEKITTNFSIRRQCAKLVTDYDLLLKRNLRSSPTVSQTYIWNSTYDNTTGTNAAETDRPIIQDVSHGNHVVSYIVASYELGSSTWTHADILKLCNTFKEVIYDKRNNKLSDNVDGSSDSRMPGRGYFIADGWAKLGKYDDEIATILFHLINKREIKNHNRGLQLKALLKP